MTSHRKMKSKGRCGATLMVERSQPSTVAVSLMILVIAAALQCTAAAGRQFQQDMLNRTNSIESFALLQLKNKLNDSLGNLWSWNSRATTPCDGSWIGVACDPGRHHVITLNLTGHNLSGIIDGSSLPLLPYLEIFDLSNNELTGGIPKELGKLFWLSVIDLSFNFLTGSIPWELGLLPNLLELILSSNNLVGEVPQSLGDLKELHTLHIDVNSLKGHLPVSLANCSALRFVDFSENYIVGGIPRAFGRLLLLQELMGSNNRLDGKIPSELGNCSLLYYIALTNNGLVGSIPISLGNLSAIFALDLFNNRLSGSIPASLCNFKKISLLQLHDNFLGGSIPSCLGELPLQYLKLNENMLSGKIPRNFSSVVRMDLSDNHLIGQIPPEFGEISSLYELILYGNNLTGPVPASIGRNGTLTILNVGWNALTGELPATICDSGLLQEIVVQSNRLSGRLPSSIGNCQSLRWLLLAENDFEGSLPISIGELGKNLYYVDISDNKFSGSIPYQIGGCSNITALLLSQNLFEGSLPVELGELRHLEEFNISRNFLTGPLFPSTFLGCSRLFTLDLSSNLLSGSIPEEFGALKQLHILRMQNNLLSGSIPVKLRACRGLLALDLGNNQLGGAISGSMLGSLVNLQTVLNLSHNIFSGEIPTAVGNLVSLVVLDLSYNHLEGRIPSTFANLGSILHLNLSHNNLSGIIPHTRVFNGISADSYLANPGLVCVFNGTRPNSLINNCTADGNPIPASTFHKRGAKGSWFPGSLTDWVIVGLGLLMFFFFLVAGFVLRHVRWKRRPHKQQQPIELKAVALLYSDLWDNISTDQITSATKNLREGDVIGRGEFGIVYKANLETGEVLAVKEVKIKHTLDSSHFKSYLGDIQRVGRVRHRNIVRLYGYCKVRSAILIIYKYIANGSLGDLLHRSKSPIDFQTRFMIALGTAHGIFYLHSDCKIVHRDIKANNILLNEDMEPYLTDFGVAKLMVDHSEESVPVRAGSIGYLAPEYCHTTEVLESTTKITEKSDIYSFGVVLLELLTRISATCKAISGGTNVVPLVRSNFGIISVSEAPNAENNWIPYETILPTLDPELQSTTDSRRRLVITHMFTIALMCTNQDPKDRPTMEVVINLLLQAKETQTPSTI